MLEAGCDGLLASLIMPTDKSHTLDSSPIIALKDAGHLARLFAYGLALSALAVAQEFKAGAVEPADISIDP